MIFSALFLMATIYAACGAIACHVAMNRLKRLNLIFEAQEMETYRDKYIAWLVGCLVLLVGSVM